MLGLLAAVLLLVATVVALGGNEAEVVTRDEPQATEPEVTQPSPTQAPEATVPPTTQPPATQPSVTDMAAWAESGDGTAVVNWLTHVNQQMTEINDAMVRGDTATVDSLARAALADTQAEHAQLSTAIATAPDPAFREAMDGALDDYETMLTQFVNGDYAGTAESGVNTVDHLMTAQDILNSYITAY